MTFLRLNRSVARTSAKCHWCRWSIGDYDALYQPTIGDVVLADFCSRRCAEKSTPIELRTEYDA